MKKLGLLALYILIPYLMVAQQQTEYNRRGDDAVRNRDYSDARLYYAEGITVCDMYSIKQLTKMWLDNEQIRPSMYNLMGRCLTCLNNNARKNDREAIAQLAVYYSEGIGTAKDESAALLWRETLNKLENPVIEQSTYTGPREVKQPVQFFAGYSFSVLSPIGVTIGGLGRTFGLYGRFKTNAFFQSFEGEIDNSSSIFPVPETTYLKYEGQMRNTLSATGGFVFRCNEWLNASIGVGYYKNDKIFHYSEFDDNGNLTNSSRYFKMKDHSYGGITTEIDGIISIGQLYVSIGFNYNIASSKNQKGYVDLSAGFGIFF